MGRIEKDHNEKSILKSFKINENLSNFKFTFYY